MPRPKSTLEQKIIINCNELDYEKLTLAIVKAQKEIGGIAKKEIMPTNDKYEERISFWQAVKSIVKNDRSTNGNMISGILGKILSIVFNFMALLVLLFATFFLISSIQIIFAHEYLTCTDYCNAIVLGVFIVLMVILCVLLALLFRASANEIQAEKDREYIIALFSGLVSFVALVVAFAALFNDNTKDIVTILEELKEYFIE